MPSPQNRPFSSSSSGAQGSLWWVASVLANNRQQGSGLHFVFHCSSCCCCSGIEKSITKKLVMTCLSFIFKKHKSSQEQLVGIDKEIPDLQHVRIYSYKQLKHATEDFSIANKIGEGGFGPVYKGRLKDGTIVAIKVLSSYSKQGLREFLAEISSIANVVHDNLVKLYGCCVEGNHRILIYNYLANNSLAESLLGVRHSNIRFNWRTRAKICIGVARGLTFLHEEVQPHIVHRDIKASNILLDSDLTPKISDFGLARLLPPNITHVNTRVAGTTGYLAPEYALRGYLTRRADIYSFGVLLLEIVTGRCNTNLRLPVEDQLLVVRTWTLYERNELVLILDSDLNGDCDAEEACKFLKVGLLCTQDDPRLRPQMSTVVKMLTGERDVNLEKITRPGIISDIMTLKLASQSKAEETVSAEKMSSGLSVHGDSPSSSEGTMPASFSFNAICDRHG